MAGHDRIDDGRYARRDTNTSEVFHRDTEPVAFLGDPSRGLPEPGWIARWWTM